MIIDKILRINNKIGVAIALEEKQIFGQSLIQEVYDESFSIMVPIRDGHAVYLAPGDDVSVFILTDNVRYAFETKVLGKELKSGIKLVVLKKPQKLTTADRRDSVRINTLLFIQYAVIENNQADNWENIEPNQEAYVINLSGKGLRLSLKWPILKGVLIVLSLHLETKKNKVKVKLLGEVVRCEEIDGLYQIGVNFASITESQQSLIIRYVFENLRKSIQLNREDY